jgi:hypothetical protein
MSTSGHGGAAVIWSAFCRSSPHLARRLKPARPVILSLAHVNARYCTLRTAAGAPRPL